MILRTNKLQEDSHLEVDGDKVTLTRHVNLDPNLQACYDLRKDQQNGWNKDRSMRRVASIPFDLWNLWCKKFPELLLGDHELKEKTLKKLLYSEEGKNFWTVGKGV